MTVPDARLRAVKIVHTIAWAFLAACVLVIPIFVLVDRLAWAAVAIAIVGFEVLVLAANRFRCPLTDIAARYTSDRAANFDICLPEWLARQNKLIFASLYVAGILFALASWRGWLELS